MTNGFFQHFLLIWAKCIEATQVRTLQIIFFANSNICLYDSEAILSSTPCLKKCKLFMYSFEFWSAVELALNLAGNLLLGLDIDRIGSSVVLTKQCIIHQILLASQKQQVRLGYISTLTGILPSNKSVSKWAGKIMFCAKLSAFTSGLLHLVSSKIPGFKTRSASACLINRQIKNMIFIHEYLDLK